MEKGKSKKIRSMNIPRPTNLIVLFIFFWVIGFPSTRASLAGVDPLSGDFSIEQIDISLRFHSVQIDILRSFNSLGLDKTGKGGWSFLPFQRKLFFQGRDRLLLRDGGNPVLFERSKGEVFISRDGEKVFFSKNEFTRGVLNGNLEVYDAQGKLLRIVYANGKTLSIVHSGDKIEKVAIGDKELLAYSYNRQGSISTIKTYSGMSASYQYNEKGLLTEAKNEDLLTTHYAYDEKDRLVNITFETGEFIGLTYHGETGSVKSVKRVDGIVQYDYDTDTNGLVKETVITHPTGIEKISVENSGKTIRHTDLMENISESHYEDGRLARYVDAKGFAVDYKYDSSGRLVQILSPDGGKTTFSYLDETSLVRKQNLPNGSTVEFFYNDKKQLVKRQGPGDFIVSYSYNNMGLMESLSYGQGEKKFWKKYVYDLQSDMGLPLEETDSMNRSTKYKYDSRGKITGVVDPLGKSVIFQYNENGLLTEVSNLSGVVSSRKYDKNLRLVEVLDHFGFSTKLSYDNKGNLEMVDYPKGTSEILKYDNTGLLRSVLDSNGNWRSYEYNKLGSITKKPESNGETTNYRYDGYGNLVGVQEAFGLETKREYDGMGRIKSAIHPGGIRHDYTYDKVGNIIAEKDGIGNTKSYVYDSSGYLTRVVLPNGEKALYEYDKQGLGNLVSAKTPDGREFGYEYDAACRMIQEKTPRGEVISYFYDKMDHVVKKVSAGGNEVTYQYDRDGRLARIKTSDGINQSYDYDGKGNVTKIVAENFEKKLTYNEFGELIEEEYPLIGKKVRYGYDKWSNRTSLEVPGHFKINYEYDSLNRLTGIEYLKGKPIQISYDELNRKTEVSYPNGMKKRYFYWPSSNYLESIVYLNPRSQVIQKYQYTYDYLGRIRKMGNVKGQVKEFGYDSNGQLVHASLDNERTVLEYGAGLRRVSETKKDRKKVFKYNEFGQMIEADSIKVAYDSSGNLRSKRVGDVETNYFFDSLGRLSKIRGASKAVEYRYSPEGQRVEKQIGNEKYYYLYDGTNLLMELDFLKNPSKIFIHTGQELDSPLVMLQGSESWFYLTDYLGSVVALADENGEMKSSYDYEAFGLPKFRGKEPGNPFAYSGSVYDGETGWYYYRARYYDPELGIFVSPDPFPKSLEFPQDMNEYAYVYNDPVNLVDPLGLGPLDWVLWRLEEGQGLVPIKPNESPRIAFPFFLKPHVLPGERFDNRLWDRMIKEYEWLRDNIGPGTAEKFRNELNQMAIENLPQAKKPGILSSAWERGKNILYRVRASIIPPGATRVVQPIPPSATRIGAPPPEVLSPGTPAPGGAGPGIAGKWLDRIGGGIIGGLVGYRVGSEYAEMAKREGRRLTGKEYAKCAGESAARGVIFVLTGGMSELYLSSSNNKGKRSFHDPMLAGSALALVPGADKRKPEEGLARFKSDPSKMKQEIEDKLKGARKEHKVACNALDGMIEEARKYTSEAEMIEYSVPSRDTVKKWEKVAEKCEQANAEKGIDQGLEKLRNESQKNGRELSSTFKRAEALAGSCEDPLDASQISDAIKSGEDEFTKIEYRTDEAKRMGREVKEFEAEVRNSQSELKAALNDWDKLIVLKKKLPSLGAWEEKVKEAESTKEALLKIAKDLDNEVKTLRLNDDRFFEISKPLLTIEAETCDIEVKKEFFKKLSDKLENIEVTAANRLIKGRSLNDELSECLKTGRMGVLADIEKVQMEAEKIMAGIPKLQEAESKCREIKFVMCVERKEKGARGESTGWVGIFDSKKRYEKSNTRHVVLGGPFASREEAESRFITIAQGARKPYETWVDVVDAGGGSRVWPTYIEAGGMTCFIDPREVQALQKESRETVASLPRGEADDLKPKENEWFVYVNVVDSSGKGIPSASVYSHDIGGYQSKNLGGGRFRVGPFWKRSATDKRSIEIRAEVMFRSYQSFAFMPRYKNVPVLLAEQAVVEVTIQFPEEGEFMKDDRPSLVKESDVGAEGAPKPPSLVRDSSVEADRTSTTPGTSILGEEGEEKIPDYIKLSVPRTTVGRSTVKGTLPTSPTAEQGQETPEAPQQPPPTEQGQCRDEKGHLSLLCKEFKGTLK
jgi:RHS repeat-associated protein